MKSCGIHLRTISQEMFKISILDMSVKLDNLRLQLHLPRANVLITSQCVTHLDITPHHDHCTFLLCCYKFWQHSIDLWMRECTICCLCTDIPEGIDNNTVNCVDYWTQWEDRYTRNSCNHGDHEIVNILSWDKMAAIFLMTFSDAFF